MDFKAIELLSYNSVLGSELIAHFLSGSENKKIRFEFIQLLLPFIFKEEARKILTSSNGTSTLSSAFLNNSKGIRALAGIEQRISHFKNITQKSIIFASKKHSITVDEYLSIKNALEYQKEPDPYLKEFYKASFYLGKILSKTQVLDTFIKLGIKEI